MKPEFRAIADRYILDIANVRFIAEALTDEALDRRVVDSEWTVGQVLCHLANDTARQASAVVGLAAGAALPQFAGESSPGGTEGMGSVLSRLGRARDELIAGLDRLSAAALVEAPVLDRWSRHCARHGIDLAEALPELRLEPMVLNWLLYVDFSDDRTAFRRQQRLLAEVRERSPARVYEGEEDDAS
jgi:hypothetical protein